jgi:hypothetical protein
VPPAPGEAEDRGFDRRRQEDRALHQQERPRDVEEVGGPLSCVHGDILTWPNERGMAR